MRHALSAVLLLVPFVLADKTEPDDPKAPKARELKIDKAPFGRGTTGTAPAKATSAKELETAVADKDVRDAIAKLVDFRKEYVVVFHWSGSGGDRVTMSADDKEAVFTRTFGRTRDLRTHFKVFALPKKMTYRVGK
jgi:hypothetical protein